MSEIPKSYRIVYDVHCQFENFFGKEIIVKCCYSEVQAKYKLGAYCEKKYGREFESITFKSVTIERCGQDVNSMFNDMFGDSNNFDNIFDTLINNPKKNKK